MNQVIQLSLDDVGRILIPAWLREKLHLTPGMTLIVENDTEGGVRLSIQAQESPLVYEGSTLVALGEPIFEFDDITRLEREERVNELVRRTGL